MSNYYKIGIVISLLLMGVITSACLTASSTPLVKISNEGKVQIPITYARDASEEVMSIADELGKHLERITTHSFQVEEYDQKQSIIVGTSREWPEVIPDVPEGESSSLRREDYVLKTTIDGSLFVVGRTEAGLRNALWDLMFRIGFRQFFPSQHWEIWPHRPDLSLALDVYETPSYPFRLLTVGVSSATWPENSKAAKQWKVRNRMEPAFFLETGHVYDRIIGAFPDHFEEYPEDVVANGKLDPSRQTALQVALRYAELEFRKNPNKDSVSMDPSDGGGWRKDSPLGSPSNQAVVLANHVAKSIRKLYPGKKVGIYAYNEHSAAPDIEVDRDVVVSVATSFIKGGYTVEQLLRDWQQMGATTGIREYLSVFSWDHDLPGRSSAASPDYLAKSIKHFYDLGARYWRSEGSNGWGAHGVGYYLASRFLWDIRETHNMEWFLQDFYTQSFGNAASVMEEFFTQFLFKDSKPMLSQDLIGRMYRMLDKALQIVDSEEDARRVMDFVLYTRYVELMLHYRSASGKARVVAYQDLARFAYQNRASDMFNSYAIFRNIPSRDPHLKTIPRWNEPEGGHPLKMTSPMTVDELIVLLEEGIQNNPVVDFEPVGYSSNLIPLSTGTSENGKTGSVNTEKGITVRGTNTLYLHSSSIEKGFRFRVRGGLIYGSMGPVRIHLYSNAHPILEEPVDTVEVIADKSFQEVQLMSPYSGLHKLVIIDGGDRTELIWPAGQYLGVPLSPEYNTRLWGRYDLAFYVPKGTQVVAGYSALPKGRVLLPNGQTIFRFDSMDGPGYFQIEVPAGMDGSSWTLSASGEKLLLTVPPFASRGEAELLIPQEIIP